VRLASSAFPTLVHQTERGTPQLPAGQRITRFINGHAARVDIGGGKSAVIESLTPIGAPTASGGYRSIDLHLAADGHGFAPVSSPASVNLPKDLRSGVRLTDSGLTLTPVDGFGHALGAAGVSDGASVVYPNSQTDADTVVKPTSTGFETYTLLRSVGSPQQLSFRVGPAKDTRLVKGKGSKTFQVLVGEQSVASVLVPDAHDVEGAPVPLSVGVSGNILSLKVDHRGGAYLYPITVDPTVNDTKLHFEWEGGNWGFETDFPSNYKETESTGTLVDTGSGSIPLESWGLVHYGTQGKSRIYGFIAETASTRATGKLANVLEIINSSLTSEARTEFSTNYSRTRTELCPAVGCATSGGSNENVAFYEQVATSPEGSGFTATLYSATVEIVQEEGPSSSFNTTSPTINGSTNVLYAGGWLGPNSGIFEVKNSDPGIGISEWSRHSPQETGWDKSEVPYCEGVQCAEERSFTFDYYGMNEKFTRWNNTHNLPDGEDTVEFKVKNATGSSATATTKVKVDASAPHEITLTGLPPNLEIGNGVYHLKASAKDGSGTLLSSGVASLVLKVDGVQVGSPSGSCSPGPCTASAEWVVSGSEFGVGQHEVTVTATDAAANVATEKFTMYVSRPTSPLPVGPGVVDPQSGELTLSATDVSMTAPAGGLTVSRTYGSLHLTAGAEGPLGPQWSINLGGGQNFTKLPNGDMLLTDGNGLQAVFASEGSGKFAAPKGDQGLVLTERTVEGKVQYLLKDGSGSTTVFSLVSGGSGNVWMDSTREEPNGLGNVAVTYQVSGGITEPTEVLAPVPAGVTCGAELKRGCRALTFNYASSTTATGEMPSGWGDYVGRLTRVYFTAWDPESAKMTTTTLAQYAYDTKGWLRAEWDPRISPALKTTYGYDSTGRVIALTPPGQQPWLFTHGTIQGDTRTGRLLSVTRPSASTAFGNGNVPANTAVPTITGTATVGSALTASTGSWSNSPLSYAYQWENCNNAGAECTAIIGAVNSTYTVLPSSSEHKIVVQVTASNAAGTGVASSSASAYVVRPTRYFYQFGTEGTGNGQFKGPAGTTVDSSGNVWVVDSGNNRIEKFQEPGKFLASYGSTGTGTGQFKSPTGVVINPSTGKVYVVDTGNNRVQILDSAGKYVSQFGTAGTGNGQFKEPTGIAVSTEENAIYVVDKGNNRIELFNLTTNAYAGKYGSNGTELGQVKSPTGVAAGPNSNLNEGRITVTDTGNNRGEGIVTSLCSLLCTQFGSAGSGNGQFSSPWGLTMAASSRAFVVDSGNNRVQEFYNGEYKSQFGSNGSGYFGQFKAPKWISEATTGTYSGGLYISDSGNNRVVLASPARVPDPPMTAPTPPSYGTSAVSTIEYNVPVSGPSAPYALGASEVATWGETAEPAQGTAIFPPDEPEGWPAQDYKRASIVYLDTKGREVNAAAPGGAISTTEYNSSNEVTRTLTPGNREAALKAGAKSAEVSHELDTILKYTTEGAEAGLELTGTLGPQHKVKLANGTEVEAREHTLYSYDEGAPSEGGPYRLVTKVTVGAYIAGKPEEDIRTTTTSYNGQENLGWTLHKPTSVTVDPGGLNLTRKTVYDPATGNVVETKDPGASSTETSSYVFKSAFGSVGSGNGQLKEPMGVAKDAGGNLWVSDSSNNRIEEFSSTGTYIAKYGSEGTGNGQLKRPSGIAVNQSNGNVYVADQNNNRIEEFNFKGEYVIAFGSWGEENGKFKSPAGVSLDSSGNVWVTDYSNNRVQEFSSTGTFIKTFGTKGTGNGQFEGPTGLAFVGESVYVTDCKNNRVEKFSLTGTYQSQFGTHGSGNGNLACPEAIVSEEITGNLFVADAENNRVEEFTSAGGFVQTFGALGTGNGQFKEPLGLAMSGRIIFVTDWGNNRIEKWTPLAEGTHATQTIYYTAAANSGVPTCGEHAEFESLVCETRPAEQPETGGVPNLPVATVTYNIWGEPLTATDTVGTTTRTSTNTYDSAGRPLTTAVASSVGTALPTVKNEYNSETGMLVKQSTTAEGKTKTLTSELNTLGQTTSYTDSDENVSTATYDIDGRQEKTNDGKGTQTFTYDATTGLLTKLVDSAAGTFTGTYDVEGNLTTEGYPNGMNVNHTINSVGEETTVEYVKITHCTEKCTWFSDSVAPSISGQWLSQVSTLSSQAYTYDNAGRLTRVQDTPVGKGCTTRLYAYDIETNRTSETTRNPTESGACASEGGTVEAHTYDLANRLLDSGVSYDTFGNTTKLPAVDAGGTELASTYYADDTLASQTQNGQTIGYYLDPAGRPRETVSTGVKNSTIISHYSGGGDTPAWTVDTGGNWTRNINGIGGFAATQYNGEAPVLQIEDLHGDIVATASISETATALASTNDVTEYGVPRTSSPPKYSWLGGEQKSTELQTGVIAMGVRSYVPQLGRFMQTDPVSGGSANAYAYTYGDPVNSSDPSGEFVPGWFKGVGTIVAKEVTEAEAAREAAAAAAALAAAAAASGGHIVWVDPHCKLQVWMVEEKGNIYGRSRVKCDKLLPVGTELAVCIEDVKVTQKCEGVGSGWDPRHPKRKHVPLHKNLYAHAGTECTEGEPFQAHARFKVPGVHTWYRDTAVREDCNDMGSTVVEFLFQFVEPEWEG
jgi:RHS repeat-associated protein